MRCRWWRRQGQISRWRRRDEGQRPRTEPLTHPPSLPPRPLPRRPRSRRRAAETRSGGSGGGRISSSSSSSGTARSRSRRDPLRPPRPRRRQTAQLLVKLWTLLRPASPVSVARRTHRVPPRTGGLGRSGRRTSAFWPPWTRRWRSWTRQCRNPCSGLAAQRRRGLVPWKVRLTCSRARARQSRLLLVPRSPFVLSTMGTAARTHRCGQAWASSARAQVAAVTEASPLPQPHGVLVCPRAVLLCATKYQTSLAAVGLVRAWLALARSGHHGLPNANKHVLDAVLVLPGRQHRELVLNYLRARREEG